jgi:23S rRNA (cytidine1920-2'-O)/16S rRNA (cytidine1409-2'-O)-methyltransferase
VARSAERLGWGTAGVARSPLPGPSGNVEFFLWLRKDADPPDPDLIDTVVRQDPQPPVKPGPTVREDV